MRVSEADLDHAFADALLQSPTFQRWWIAGSRFARYEDAAYLLNTEQAQLRKAKHWWKHWWVKLPDGSESETDIFFVFDSGDDRFAFHVENKPADGKLPLKQAIGYRRRAVVMANQPRWLSYSDFETVLIAPKSFLSASVEAVAQFDRAVSYESIGEFVPLYRQVSSET